MTLTDEQPLAILGKHDAVWKGQTRGDQMGFACGVDIMNGADKFIFARFARVGKVEATLGIESQIVRTSQRLAIAFFGCRSQRFSIAI